MFNSFTEVKMKLYVKPKDEEYEDLEYLINQGSVKINVFKMLFTLNEEDYGRYNTFMALYADGFLDIEEDWKNRRITQNADWKLTSTFVPGKYEVLKNKTIVLYSRPKRRKS